MESSSSGFAREEHGQRPSFRELLQQLEEVHEAEIAHLKECIYNMCGSSKPTKLARLEVSEDIDEANTHASSLVDSLVNDHDSFSGDASRIETAQELNAEQRRDDGRDVLKTISETQQDVDMAIIPPRIGSREDQNWPAFAIESAELGNLASVQQLSMALSSQASEISRSVEHGHWVKNKGFTSESIWSQSRRSILSSNRSNRNSRDRAKTSGPASTKTTGPLEDYKEPQTYLRYTKFEHFCYVVDTWLSKRSSQFLALAMLLLSAVFIFGSIWTVSFARSHLSWYENILEGLWVAWTFMADPGTHADVGLEMSSIIDEQPERIIGALIAAAGIVFMGAMLGMIVDIIREKMDSLRQGKSYVVESHHTLILGWTEKAVSIIEELCFANESDGGGTIVVLSPKPKEMIEREFFMQFPPRYRKGTRVVFRTGNPMVVTDLMKVAAPTARATIILSNDGDPDNADAETLRVMLSLRTLPYKLEGHVVAEVRDIDNEPLINMIGADVVETLVSHDVLGRLMLMSARQPGLAKVYEYLLGFQGDEFYMSEWPQLVGVTFGCLFVRFPDAIPIGVFTSGHELILNPEPNRPMQTGEKILVIAEDDDTYKPEDPVEVEEGIRPSTIRKTRVPQKILFCGWRRDIRDIVLHLDHTLQQRSEIHMITGYIPIDQRTDVLMDEGLDVSALKHVRLIHHYGNPSVRRRLSSLPLSEFDSCMIFSDQAFETDTMQADSHSLATLLLLRDMQQKEYKGSEDRLVMVAPDVMKQKTASEVLKRVIRQCPIICEVKDPRTQKTISGNQHVRNSADFCQTNKITAQMLAMIAENRSVNVLFDELLGVEGNTVNVYPSSRYTANEEKVSFWTVAKRASQMKETLIGYKARNDVYVDVNPPFKNETNTWQGFDFIVISQSETLPRTRCDSGMSKRS